MLLEQLFDNLALTVEAFSTCQVAPGWRLRLPGLDWATLHFVVQGEGAVRDAGGDARTVRRNSLALVPPHLMHTIECGPGVQAEAAAGTGAGDGQLPDHIAGPREEAELIVVCGRVHATYGSGVGLFDQLHDVLVLDFSDEPRMRELFEALLEEQREAGPARRVMMAALMNQCLVEVFRRLCSHPDCRLPWLLALEDPDLARVVETVLARPDDPHTVASLAELAFMSRSTFARRFRDSFDRTPMQFVRDVRLRHAARLLRSTPRRSVSTVAKRVGFDSRSQFSRAFSDFFGCSPTEFREQTASEVATTFTSTGAARG